ncbi:hypothetical protein [Pseudorhodoferax sp. Leaf265]|uniref:hypothetical protein n=1 Tax=Pseudorhodoferax sp. Leaf265 TaxID=1736315 RepID=UPI0012E921A4|nr:hypothetical protein [Pseudorhodoferax sp. Leaf265]
MKSLAIALALLAGASSAFASPGKSGCEWRGKLVEAIAKSRDLGAPRETLVAETVKQLKGRVPVSNVRTWVDVAYDHRDFTPSQLRQVTELSCLRE